MGNCFQRLYEADQRLDDESIKRLLAEQIEDSRDDRILKGFDVEDLHQESLKMYRQVYASRMPESPWGGLENREFLAKIGGWRKDRETGEHGLTLAGLLMFGTHPVIQEALPYYMLDYQERPEAKTENRWVDRLTLDGSWSGNLYDFYRKVYTKLISDLKVPFKLKGDQRKDETDVHVAIREAFCNVLVHADYSDRASVLVVKRPDMFGFRNPGLMRIPPEVAIEGGHPDCRNRKLHQMFRYIGIGDQAGTGLPKIFEGWKRSHWRAPSLHEKRTPHSQTLLEMRMIDLFPSHIMEAFQRVLGNEFTQMSHTDQTALAVAATEGTITHDRLKTLSSEHAADISRSLRSLVDSGLLKQTGSSRGAVYHLSGIDIPEPDDVFDSPNSVQRSPNYGQSSPNSGQSSPNLASSSPNLDTSSPNYGQSSPNYGQSSPNSERNDDGLLISQTHKLPFVDRLSELSEDYRKQLKEKALQPQMSQRIPRAEMDKVLRELCKEHYIRVDCLAELVNREVKTLREQYLSKMVREKVLEIAFPKTPNDPRQAYTLK